jgi:nucleotide-binding universal stress UspA family protein
VDFSDGSRRALEQAAAIARRCGSHITLLHVYQTQSPFDAPPAADDAAVGDQQQVDMLRTALQTFAQSVAGDVAVSFRLRHGANARRPIVAEVDAGGVDLLVIGSHEHGAFERILLGSTTDAVARKADCPVLAVPAGAHPASDGRFRRVLCAMDFSPSALRAFRYLVHLACARDADVTLLHVLEVPPELHDRQIAAAFDVDAVRDAAAAAARQRLEALSPGHDEPPVRIHARVAGGRAHRQILEIARQQQADLIVLGIHGRHTLDRWLFGSNTNAVLRDAPCPVLTVGPE